MIQTKYLWIITLLMVLMSSSVLGATLNGSSSIYSFNVTNCQADDYLVGCGVETIKFSCDITNKQFIDYTTFIIDNSSYVASVSGFNFYVDYVKPNQTSTINTTIDFTRIYVTDTNSDTAVFDESVSVVNDCVTCTDVGYADACAINDSTTFYHVFEPFNCSVDFNESIVCDYCEQDMVQTLGECNINNSQSVSYYDANYFSCCAVTGLDGDCDILDYPYNETTTQSCEFLVQDFECDFPNLAELTSEMSFSCLMPDNDDYKCIVNVYEDGRVVQVNPEYKSFSQGVISVGGKREESKEFFTPTNRLLNAYFTNKNLQTESDFVVEVVCSSDTELVKSQHLVEPFYKSTSSVLNRLNWAKGEMGYIIAGLFLAFFVLVLIGYAWNVVRGKK